MREYAIIDDMSTGGNHLNLPQREEKILKFWERNKIFEKTLAKTKKGKPFTFYDGPPFATGLPHYGHILASTIKDVIPRFETMRGRFVRRRWGWDCHGLPIEEIVERKLGISGKKQIEKIGIQKFNEICRSTVLTYVHEWGKMVKRIARWTEFDTAYKTMDANYMESVWWAFKQIYEKGFVYEGRRVLLYCPRCETPVSNFEVAMDDSYETVTEEAVTVKFALRSGQKIRTWNVPERTYVLAWTTTPWTLPGNVALAVGEGISYSILELKTSGTRGWGHGGELTLAPGNYIVATERVGELTRDGNYFSRMLAQVSGRDLVGLSYSPLFEIPAMRSEKSYRVYPADFVTTTEGTGVVHTAVVYGEGDYQLGVREGLPVVPLLDEKGKFNEHAPSFLRGVYFKDAEKIIKNDLSKRELLFLREQHSHSYPHCWRCRTMLFYNAIPAWFINIQKIKRRLLRSNIKEINWFPTHLKRGRYEKSVEQAPDWNISRNRYWGNPIPVWRCMKCKHDDVVGSLEEFARRAPSSRNRYVAMRHGHSETLLLGVADDSRQKYHLTDTGRREVEAQARRLVKERFDLIVASPVLRTQETASILSKVLGVKVATDPRLREIHVGVFEHKPASQYHAYFSSLAEKFTKPPPKGETLNDLKKRLMSLMTDLEQKHRGKRILLVSHEYPIWILWGASQGLSDEAMVAEKDQRGKEFVKTGSILGIPYRALPRDASGEVNLHRPYVDEVTLLCSKCGGAARRITEIFDSWTEAGSMPFAEYHYPFEGNGIFKKRFPAQFVAEYIAQTRAWFYVMHVISFILFREAPFENVVTTGTILAEDGSKMSKSRGNFPDPWEVLRKYGADSVRFYLMNSVVMQADNLNFNVRDLETTHRKVALILWNVHNYFVTYADHASWQRHSGVSKTSLLDRWIEGRTQQLVEAVTKHLDSYDTVRATRSIAAYIDDLSRWYVRRSRGRRDDAFLRTLHGCLVTTSRVIAPFMPYMAEMLYRSLITYSKQRGSPESVHLTEWPKANKRLIDEDLIRAMEEVRRLAGLGLAKRAMAGIKVRQPLAKLKLRKSIVGKEELVEILRSEVNVKEVVTDAKLSDEVDIDTAITPELREEGMARELVRNIQELRRDAGLKPKDRVRVEVGGDAELERLADHWQAYIKKETGAVAVETGGKKEAKVSREVNVDGKNAWVGIRKA